MSNWIDDKNDLIEELRSEGFTRCTLCGDTLNLGEQCECVISLEKGYLSEMQDDDIL